jgi:hypothetical protein
MGEPSAKLPRGLAEHRKVESRGKFMRAFVPSVDWFETEAEAEGTMKDG